MACHLLATLRTECGGSENLLCEDPAIYGARSFLKAARPRAGLSVAELAKRVGYSVATYQDIEQGRSQMGEKMARKIAAVLGVDAAELMNGADLPPGFARGYPESGFMSVKSREIQILFWPLRDLRLGPAVASKWQAMLRSLSGSDHAPPRGS